MKMGKHVDSVEGVKKNGDATILKHLERASNISLYVICSFILFLSLMFHFFGE